jgi:hypothetical protein
MRNFKMSVAAVVIALTAFGTSFSGQETPACKIQVLSPQKGDKVGTSGPIRGTASVPPGRFLWVFIRKEGQRNWWPQGGGAVEVKPNSWVVDAVYGDENNPQKDSGANFEITAVIVDQPTNAKLDSYVETTNKTGRYPGTPLPPAAKDACALKDNIVVQRQ